jgi:electron transfer flavoprotein alpha subunit
MAGVLVFGESTEGTLNATSLEIAAAGKQVADALGLSLLGALIGSEVESAGQEFLSAGFSQLFVTSGAQLKPYRADDYVAAGEAIISRCDPSVVLFAHNLNTREWVPRLGFRLGTGVVTDCTAVRVEGGELVLTKPIYGGSATAEYQIKGTPQLATVRAQVFEPLRGQAAGEIVPVEFAPVDERVSVLSEEFDAPTSGPRLKDARVVVCGGRGLGGPENWHLIEETAAVLGAAVGASRPVTDSAWVPSSYQVGLTGTSVAPDLYIAVGISGAVQHLAGISGARTVVAINRDPQADIFGRAQYGAVGDCKEILPAFVERVKQLRG